MMRSCLPTRSNMRMFTTGSAQESKRIPFRPRPEKYRGKLKGHGPDLPLITISKTMSYILRHGAEREGIPMRQDGYVRVRDLLSHPSMRSVNFTAIREIVDNDNKKRFDLRFDPSMAVSADPWWICANQGHSMEVAELELQPVFSAERMPTVIHGTTVEAWPNIEKIGISRMGRNHIHLAQGFKQDGVFSGIRHSSRVLIYIDVSRALKDGIRFFLSKNGVVLTPGDANGFLSPRYFHRVHKVTRDISQIPIDKDLE